ncbi:putative GRIP-related Arf-binding domain containing protein [Lyophyllum shimeji]|uniref:GRIP-related Arf-binding domain containing protein n=1 Tax=Lyophyllum shimeji TaxID=47721 RepID=A0A9P3PVJ9_LYOSH|nr:putative GRIP-related Arf-binding domain containing protein [Lyophyllum shimeji]
MSGNGTLDSGSSSTKSSAKQDASDARSSLDSERSLNLSADVTANGTGTNGHSPAHNGDAGKEDDDDPIAKLQRELERTREEKDTLATQYRNLLAKLTTMRTTLGNKLKQDAEELDRREQLVQQLTAQNDDLTSTVESLKEELIASHEEAERAAKELDAMRSRALEENAQETLLRERELRETQTELERCRMEREEWKRTAMQERALAEDLKSSLETYKRELDLEREAREAELQDLEAEREQSNNLQSVLQDFQAARDHELKQAIKDYETQLTQVTQSLAEFKSRALTAELKLEESRTNLSRTQELEKEVKEKNLLIGKLRHEAVIINEHLMEALRRLRRNSADTNVDRRLVTNVLLSFLTTPRADAKRFEMLSLLATILSWSDAEREKAGLQRASNAPAPAPASSFWGRSSASNSPAKGMDLEKTDETESFSRLWVEFLLTEAASGESPSAPDGSSSPQSRNNTSLPGTPTHGTMPKGGAGPGGRRLASYAAPGMASSPNLVLAQPPSRKGKERDMGPGS